MVASNEVDLGKQCSARKMREVLNVWDWVLVRYGNIIESPVIP